MTDYLIQARQHLDADAFGQARPPGDVQYAIAYALVDIAQSLRKLRDEPIYVTNVLPPPPEPLDEIVRRRIDEVRYFCKDQIAHYGRADSAGWAAQGVLNILDGNIDEQLTGEDG